MQLLCFYIEHNSDSKGLCSFRLKLIPSERVIVSALNNGQRNFGTINYFEFWVGVLGTWHLQWVFVFFSVVTNTLSEFLSHFDFLDPENFVAGGKLFGFPGGNIAVILSPRGCVMPPLGRLPPFVFCHKSLLFTSPIHFQTYQHQNRPPKFNFENLEKR